jgi:methionyl aminopeptidase
MMDRSFIAGMRKAGKLAARTLSHVIKHAKEGITTNELDQIASDFTLSNGGQNACLGYRGYPKSICTSLNEVLCHGVPDDTKLVSGDLINIDVTVSVNGYFGDTSATIGIGTISEEVGELIHAAYGARMAGIQAVRPFGRTGDIGFSTTNWIQSNYPGWSLVKDIGGHGIGKTFHMDPFVPSVGKFGQGFVLKPWTCITVEPIVWEDQGYIVESIPLSSIQVYKGKDGLAAQFEHTILVTATGFEILTEG